MVVCLALINAQNLNKNFNKFMKKILPILFLGILINISFINNDSAKADHYKTGIIFADPYVIGCIYDLLDASFDQNVLIDHLNIIITKANIKVVGTKHMIDVIIT